VKCMMARACFDRGVKKGNERSMDGREVLVQRWQSCENPAKKSIGPRHQATSSCKVMCNLVLFL
jgi:hypothetical protein